MSREIAPGVLPADDAAEPEEPAIDPVPDDVRAAARRAFSMRDRGAELLTLVFDSLVDEAAVPTAARRLVFARPDVPGHLAVTVLEEAGPSQVAVVLECPWPDVALDLVESAGQSATPVPSGPGRWSAGPLPHGLFRASLTVSGTPLQTSWVRV